MCLSIYRTTMKYTTLILILSLSIPAFAEDSIYLEKEQKAPYSGILLPKEKVQELRVNTELKESLERSIILYKQNEEIYQKNQTLLIEQNQSLIKSRGMTDLEKVLWLVGGVLLTGISVWGAGQLK